jgi:hypothetical protein
VEIILSCQYILVKAKNPKFVCSLIVQVFDAIVLWDSETRTTVLAITSRNVTVSQAVWRLKRNTVLEIRKDPWFWWHQNKRLKHLPRPFVHLTRLFKPCLRLYHFPGALEGSKIHTSAETRRGPKNTPKFTSDQPLVHYRQAFWEADLKSSPKPQWGRRLSKCKSVWLLSKSQHDTSMCPLPPYAFMAWCLFS